MSPASAGLICFCTIVDKEAPQGYKEAMSASLYAVLSALQAQDFHTAVYRCAQLIPAGKVLGYGHLASMIGRPGYARHVGTALSRLLPETSSNMVPWWRVVRSDGSIAMQGDVTRGPRQIALLQQELVPFTSPHKVNMRLARWTPELD